MKFKDKKSKKVDNEPIALYIPEDEIWTFRVPGLAEPNINKPYKHYTLKKIIFALTIIVAVSLSVYFSIRTVQKDVYTYEPTGETYQFSAFSNNGEITELTIDYVFEKKEDKEKGVFYEKNEDKVITSVREYTLNCDEKVEVINIGKDVTDIDPKAFYSCWALQRIEVAEDNPKYCDIDGVLYNKDKTTIICYPCNHDQYLRDKYGYKQEPYRMDVTEEYRKEVQTYVVPSTVTTIGELCFNYANLRDIYLPEGVTRIETLSFFKLHEPWDQYGNTASLENIYTYIPSGKVEGTGFTSEEALGEVYNSLPETLKFIGSDAFSYNRELKYVYIPASVEEIGHHAFWDNAYKEDGEIKGLAQIEVALSEEDFEKVKTGDQWRPEYDHLLFKKKIDAVYSADRK